MELERRIEKHFHESLKAKQDTLATAVPRILAGAELMVNCLNAGGKVLSCGNGGSAADAQHFSAELLNRYERERPGIPGIALTTDTSTLTSISNDYDYQRVFARQVTALGRNGDVLLAISTSGNSPSVIAAVDAAHEAGMRVVAMTGRDGGKLARQLRADDAELRAIHTVTARIQEVHLLFLHCLCDLIDEIMFPAGIPAGGQEYESGGQPI